MSALPTTLSSSPVFYPLFAALVLLWLCARHLLRRRWGSERWQSAVRGIERGVLTTLLLAMLGFAALQILLRNVFHSGLIWIEPLTRHLVLWLGFVGAVVATGQMRHIQMDVFGRLLPHHLRLGVLRFTCLMAAVVCAILSRAAWLYLRDEAAFGSRGFLGIPVWELTAVIFLGFAVMAARFATRVLESDQVLMARRLAEETDEPA